MREDERIAEKAIFKYIKSFCKEGNKFLFILEMRNNGLESKYNFI